MKTDPYGHDITPGVLIAWVLALAVWVVPWIWMETYY
jgi:hypothetical protein